MSNRTIVITSASGVIIRTDNRVIAEAFLYDGAIVEYETGNDAVFSDNVKRDATRPNPVYPVWMSEREKDMIVAHWEKTGMFASIVNKIRAVENTKKVK